MEIAKSVRGLRRQVAGFSLAMLIAGLFAINVAQAATFTDVQPGDWFYTYVEQLAADGILNTSFSEYRPGDKANRAEAAKLLVEAFDLTLENPDTPTFKDVAKGTWYYQYVETAYKYGVVSGYKDNTGTLTGFFGPGDDVTREQYAKMCVGSAPLTTNIKGGPHFPDVMTNMWSYEFVETAYNWSVVDGYPDGSFKPTNNINRAEIAKITANCMNPVVRPGAGFNVDDVSAMSSTSVRVCFTGEPGTGADDAANYMITDADGVELNVTDAEISTDPMCVTLTTAAQTAGKSYDLMVSGVMSAAGEELDIPDGPFSGWSATGTGGDLTCTAGEMPAGVTVPKGATGVAMAVVNCSAKSTPVVVTGMTFHRFGSGDEGDLSDVYLYADDYRLTSGRSINSETQEVEFSGLNTTIGANETVSFWVIADIALGALDASQHAFELINADSIASNAKSVDGDFPIKGNFFTISGATAGTVSIEANGDLNELTIGETGIIAQFELELGSSEGGKVDQIALYIRGTCDSSDVTDLKLRELNSTEILASASEVGTKDLATFVLDNPYNISQGDSKIFVVEAKNTCRNNETIRTFVDETTDIHVTGTTFQSGLRVDIARPLPGNYDGQVAAGGVADGFSEVLIKGSDFNVAFNGPSAGDIAVGQDEVSCLDMTITNASGEDVTIEDWIVTVALQGAASSPAAGGLLDTSSATTTANYTLIKLISWDEDGNKKTLLGPSELSTALAASDTTQPVTLDGSSTIYAGTSVDASVVFDLANQPLMSGDKIRCTLTNLTSGADFVQDLNGDTLGTESITPSSDINGNTFNVSAAGLTFEIASTPSSRTLVSGSQNADLVAFTVRSGSSLNNTLKSITVQGYVDNDVEGAVDVFDADGTDDADAADATASVLKDIVDSLALYNGDTKVSDLESVNAADGKIVFNNLTIPVPMSTTITLTIRGKVNNAAPYGAANDRIKFGIAAGTDVVAIDGNGKNVSTGSISVLNAGNGCPGVAGVCTADAGTIMTITRGGTGTVAEQGSPSQMIFVGNSPETLLLKTKLTSDDQDVSLRDVTLGVLNRNASSLQYVKLFTGASCDQPVLLLGGGTSGAFTAGGSSGVFRIEGLDLKILDAGDTYLCVKGKTPSVTASGDPVSGDRVGISLLDLPEIIGGSGSNVSDAYIGIDSVAGGTKTPAGFLDIDAAAGDTVLDMNAALTGVAIGDVIVIDQEQMLVTTIAGDAYTVIRGFNTFGGTSMAVAHSALLTGVAEIGDDVDGTRPVWESSLSSAAGATVIAGPTSVTDTCIDVNPLLPAGTTFAALNVAGTAVEFVTVVRNTSSGALTAGECGGVVDVGDDHVITRARYGSTALAGFDVGFGLAIQFTENSQIDPLRASVPVVCTSGYTPEPLCTATQQAGGPVGAGTYTVLRFDVVAKGENSVTFNKGAAAAFAVATDDLIQVNLTGSALAGEVGICSLRDVTDNRLTDTIDVTATALSTAGIDLNFNFSDAEVPAGGISIASGTKHTFEVQCNLNLAGGTGTSVSARLLEAVNSGSLDIGDGADGADGNTALATITYNDGEVALVAESGSLIENLPIFGNSFNATST